MKNTLAKNTVAIGTVCIIVDYKLKNGKILGIRITTSREDQEAVALKALKKLLKPRQWEDIIKFFKIKKIK